MTRLAVLDLLLLVGVIAFTFGVGSTVLIWQRRNAELLRHPISWARSTYTLRRWLTNPFKLCIVALLWQANFQQLALTGPAASLAGDLDYRSRLYLTLANLIGGCMCFYALHLKDFELSLWVEISSYVSLIGTLSIWVGLVYWTVSLPNTSYGLNLTEAFILGALVRTVIVLRYKRALCKGPVGKIARLRLILGGDVGH